MHIDAFNVARWVLCPAIAKKQAPDGACEIPIYASPWASSGAKPEPCAQGCGLTTQSNSLTNKSWPLNAS